MWMLPTEKVIDTKYFMEQSYSTCYHLKWGKPKPQMPSKLCQKIGYGKTFLHNNHFHFFLLLSFNKSVKVLWIIAKYTIQSKWHRKYLGSCAVKWYGLFSSPFKCFGGKFISWRLNDCCYNFLKKVEFHACAFFMHITFARCSP